MELKPRLLMPVFHKLFDISGEGLNETEVGVARFYLTGDTGFGTEIADASFINKE